MLIRAVTSVILLLLGATNIRSDDVSYFESNTAWHWQCVEGRCEKLELNETIKATAMSLSICKMYCNDYGNMWPRPTVEFKLGNYVNHLNRNSIDILLSNSNGPAADLMRASIERFHNHVDLIIPPMSKLVEGGKALTVTITIDDLKINDLTLDTDEGYSLKVSTGIDGRINGEIAAPTFFGARHALETLEQFIVFDDIRSEIQIATELFVRDKPAYPYRGILLDTSRNFFSVESIKKIIDGMSACKMNRFHWHITDSHSFPFYSKTFPQLTKIGAIRPHKIYGVKQIADIVKYGIERGVKVVPEFDAPAHVGEGWQGTNLTVCFKAEPWKSYCVEPPCGQFDPTQDKLYDMLEGIYKDMFDVFKPDIFHMGGDEVKNACWNSSESIRNWMQARGWGLDDRGFFNLWEYFQTKAQDRVYKINNGKKIPLILWTSTLTNYLHIDEYLNKDDYIIQIWTTGVDPQIEGLLNKGYRLIISNYDALYFDCGFGAWVGEGNNWCSPYIGWQKVYDNSMDRMARSSSAHSKLILGAEATLWSEQADSAVADGRLWPRAGAVAERLWSNPPGSYTWRNAERRMLQFRERLINMGINADSLEPEWCYQNEGYCHS